MVHRAIITDLFHHGHIDRKFPADKGVINKIHVAKRLFSVAEPFYTPKKQRLDCFGPVLTISNQMSVVRIKTKSSL